MDWREFTASIVGHLVWPLFLLVILIVYKEYIVRNLSSLSKLEVGKVKFEFIDKLEDLSRYAGDNIGDAKPIGVLEQMDVKGLFAVANISPAASILAAWKELEICVAKFVHIMYPEIDFNSTSSPFKLMENCLSKTNLVDRKTAKVFHDLRVLRNKVAHSKRFEIDGEKAREYIKISWNLKRQFEEKIAISRG